MGHARLSVIDLETGDQPIANEDETIHIVVNGELYDFERIRRELEQRGHRFRTRSDSEVALHLYEDYGAHCVERLRGEFAFVIWDERNQLLFAARDRFGIKPLYCATVEGCLYLASEAKALTAASVPARWDLESVFQQLSMGGAQQDRTLFERIYQVPPGHYLLATREQVRLVRYWDFDYPIAGAPGRAARPAEQTEAFARVLDEAIRLRLRADVPVACYLSGGLDSGAILGLAARHARTPIRAFTLTFDRPEYDESAIAKEMAEHAGAEFHPVPIRQADLADDFAAAVFHAETTFSNAHGVAKYRLSRAVREAGYKVVLTGEGSDEILGGYPHFRRDMILYNREGQDASYVEGLLAELERQSQVSRGLFLPDGESLPLFMVQRTLGFVPSWIETYATMGFRLQSFLDDGFKAQFAGRDAFGMFLNGMDVRGQLHGREPVHQSLYLWSKFFLPNYILSVLGDRMEMAHSVEGRVPFLDHHVVEAASALPVAQKIRGTVEKHILREATKDVLTDAVYRRTKHPFLAPPASSAPGEKLHQLMQDTLRSDALRRVPFFDKGKIVMLLDMLPYLDEGTRAAVDGALMGVLSACLLAEQFKL